MKVLNKCYSILDRNRATVKLAFRYYLANFASLSQLDDDATFYLSVMQLRAIAKDIGCCSRCLEQLAIITADIKKSRPQEIFALKSDASSGRAKALSMSEFAEALVRIASVQFRQQPEWTIAQKLASFFELHFVPNVQIDEASNFRSLLAHADAAQALEAHLTQIHRIFSAATAGSAHLAIRTFVDLIRKAFLVNDTLSLSRLKVIFMAATFKGTDDELADWRDWNFLMGHSEFVEAVALLAAAREFPPSASLNKAVANLTVPQLVASIGKLAGTVLLREGWSPVEDRFGSVQRQSSSSGLNRQNSNSINSSKGTQRNSWSPIPQAGRALYLPRSDSDLSLLNPETSRHSSPGMDVVKHSSVRHLDSAVK
jgi:hypothetical protein